MNMNKKNISHINKGREKMNINKERKKHIRIKKKSIRFLHKAITTSGLSYNDRKIVTSVYTNLIRQVSQLEKIEKRNKQ